MKKMCELFVSMEFQRQEVGLLQLVNHSPQGWNSVILPLHLPSSLLIFVVFGATLMLTPYMSNCSVSMMCNFVKVIYA